MEELSFNVLYIEDDIIQQKVMEASQKLLKIQLHSATMGMTGLALAQQIRPTLILLDTNLPDVSGEELLTLLKEDKRISHIPVVIVTSDPLIRDKMQLWAFGRSAAACIMKPVTIPKLTEIFEQLLFHNLKT
jgi:CheY-like chemotaxis protein